MVGGPGGAMIGSSIGGMVGNKKSSSGGSSGGGNGAEYYDSYDPNQQAVNDLIGRILTQGGTPYNGARVAGMTGDQNAVQSGSRSAFNSAMPALTRILSGQFGPEQQQAFDEGVANPARRQFNLNVRPEMRENAALTGNRFADRTAIAEGRAVGELESGITTARAGAQQEAYYAPAKYGTQITNALAGFGNIFALPQQQQQAQLDADYAEWARTTPESGSQLPSMLDYLGKSRYGIETGGGGTQGPVGRGAGNFIPQGGGIDPNMLMQAIQAMSQGIGW
jgi:hypothetical protein